MFSVPVVSKGKVIEVPVEANLLAHYTCKHVHVEMKSSAGAKLQKVRVAKLGSLLVWRDYIIFCAHPRSGNTASNIKRSWALFSEMSPLLSQWSLQAQLLFKDSFIWTINTTVCVDIAFCHAALSLFSSQFYQAVNWIPFGLTVLIIILW